MANLFSKLLGAGADKDVKMYNGLVGEVNAHAHEMEELTDEELTAQTARFRERYEHGESLDHLLPEAFATVREASWRTLHMRHFDVQLIGGMVLNDGKIAEMKTGEGKTLVSTLAGYLNAIPGTGVHVVTVNDYLAKRDSQWMGQVYRKLGMTVGLIQAGMDPALKKPSYEADITYGTNSEFGFDYLRDNMVTRRQDRVQRGHAFAIVDEVDSILIDEARTPLIISGAGTRAAETYVKFARAVKSLKPEVDFEMDEAKKTIYTTESGLEKMERATGEDIYSDPSGQLVNHLQQALKAQFLFHRDVDYVVVDGEVKIVDEFTGRIMEGRRWSEGLHQAIEAKEGVAIKEENQTLATITLQNYFRLYEKLSGMTGTAMTEDAEFRDIYKLAVVAVPPNKPVIRDDRNDLVYRTIDAKFNAVADDVEERHANGQPVLVGTVSIESSEKLSRLLDKRGIKHNILNAKHHEQEARIVAQAGRQGAVTIATNMAGRGTDILLGGNPDVLAEDLLVQRGIDPEEATEEQRAQARQEARETCKREGDAVRAAGGLCVIGTERHESRRIDNQLRGRSGRQGDPGVTQFYLSLEDDLMRLFGGERMERVSHTMERMNIDDDVPLQAKMVSKAIENAQRTVEQVNFAARKHVLEYDDVMNKQREVIYGERDSILDGKDIHSRVEQITQDTVAKEVEGFCDLKQDEEDWDWDGLQTWFNELTGRSDFDVAELEFDDDLDDLIDQLVDHVEELYAEKEKALGEEATRHLEAQVMLRVIDTRWMAHLSMMDYLRNGIGLRAMGQKDPLVEYKTEAYRMFGELVDSMYEDYLRIIMRLQIAVRADAPQPPRRMMLSGPADPDGGNAAAARPQAPSAQGGARRAESQQGQQAQNRRARRAQAAALKEAGEVPKPSSTAPSRTVVKDKNDPWANVGRNDPCPCGSGLKYKKCHGKGL